MGGMRGEGEERRRGEREERKEKELEEQEEDNRQHLGNFLPY